MGASIEGVVARGGVVVELWMVSATANGAIALAYFAISRAIALPLARAGELRTNPLGVATAVIFLTCAVHHGAHAVHMLLPYFGLDLTQGLLLRHAFSPWTVGWDIFGAAAGVVYWSLRRSYGALLKGSSLYEDRHQRQQDAIEINDLVVQGLVAAQLAHRAGRPEELERALAGSLAAARTVVDRLLASGGPSRPGDFVRSVPADLGTQ